MNRRKVQRMTYGQFKKEHVSKIFWYKRMLNWSDEKLKEFVESYNCKSYLYSNSEKQLDFLRNKIFKEFQKIGDNESKESE